ncbi:MAG: nucleotide exchange factor GrpE [Planctomycetota bacterium]|nr:nucleotide exchange factor GrpE [Planctomycetota bacterium]
MQPEETNADGGTAENTETVKEAVNNAVEVEAVAEEAGAEANAGVDEALEGVLEESQEEPTPPKSDSQRVQEAEKEVLLARAEMENFRKRMQRESEQTLKYANMNLVRDLLEVGDNLQRAIEAGADDEATKGLRDGVAMVSQQMTDVLGRYGCKPIPALGEEFDPNVHEAISQLPSEEYASGMVMNEVAVGYMLHDRVVRPSNVVVSSGVPEKAE